MRLKVFALFVAVQLASFFAWKTLVSGDTAVPTQEPLSIAQHAVAETVGSEATVVTAKKPKIITPDFDTRYLDDAQATLNSEQKEDILMAFSKLPEGHIASVKTVTLDYNKEAYRGLGGANKIILRATDVSEKELLSVFIHETGHNVDYGFLAPANKNQKSTFKDGSQPLYTSDPSIIFYQISWEDEETMKKGVNNMDFVSGYAMSDPFEDFAETYCFYVLHNKDFKAMTASSSKLYSKYVFMRDFVFNGTEFNTGDAEIKLNKRTWDITLLDYDFDNFLFS